MYPFFINYKNYIPFEPTKKVFEISKYFAEIILNKNFKFIKNLYDLKNVNEVDIYYSIDCLGEISTEKFINYINIFKKNLNNNGIILIRDWWWNKDNLKYLYTIKDLKLSNIEINYSEENNYNKWYILKKNV